MLIVEIDLFVFWLQVHKLELDLSMALERYRGTQSELVQRDQAILRLKADLEETEQRADTLQKEACSSSSSIAVYWEAVASVVHA